MSGPWSAKHHKRLLRTLISAALLAGSLPLLAPVGGASVSAASGTITGLVFDDYDVNGVRRATDDTTNFLKAEPAVGGVTVRAYDSTGALVGTATTSSTITSGGNYSLSVTNAATNAVRVEFTVPSGYQPSFAASSGSTIQFENVGATGVDFGIQVPGDYCQGKPLMGAVCMQPGARTSAGKTLSTYGYFHGGAETTVAKHEGTNGSGGTWGLAYQRTTKNLWMSAFLRRTVAIGPQGLGGLYVYNSLTAAGSTPGIVASFDLTSRGLEFAPPGVDFSDAGRCIEAGSGSVRNSVLSMYCSDTSKENDLQGYEWVGRAGIGDIDMTEDGQTLFVVNLYKRQIHRIEIRGTASSPTLGAIFTWDVDDASTCQLPNSVARPFGLDVQSNGTALVGVTCAEMTATPGYSTYAEGAVVLRIDPSKTGAAAWQQVVRTNLGNTRILENCDWRPSGTQVKPCEARWMAWTNNWLQIRGSGSYPATGPLNYQVTRWPQPMLTDIEVLADGSIVTAFNDRVSYQFGGTDLYPTRDKGFTRNLGSGLESNDLSAYTSGDSRLFCNIGGTYYEESGGNCGPSGSVAYTGAKNWTLWTDEFFDDQWGASRPNQWGTHIENFIGAMALGPKNSTQPAQIAFTTMDPTAFDSNGVKWNSLADGGQLRAYDFMYAKEFMPTGFGKSSGMGDIEVLCDAAPLQIGNRVWSDADGDGVQDAGESPIAGVTVRLYDAAGVLVSTAMTDVNGEYRFSSTVTEAANGGATPDGEGGNVVPNTEYTIRLDNPADYGAGGPLDTASLFPSTANATSAATDLDDAIDADATLVGGSTYGTDRFPRISVPALSPGQNNHTFDFGFGPASVSVGDTVWLDSDQDGVLDSGEVGIPGVVLSILKADGSPVTDINNTPVSSTTTDANGRYSFANLPAGQYKVTATAPSGVVLTTSALTLTSANLTIGSSDQSLDFGFFAPSVSVGDFVWRDTDRDGVQDAGEPGIAGVTLTITKADGSAVTDVFGQSVTSTVTDANGAYVFSNLPLGQYTVSAATPSGYVATVAGQGSGSTDSSTGSATSANLTVNGASDTTLDFGFVKPAVSVGDLVWFDTDRDGVQDAGEPGIAGVTLSITKADGSAVTDVNGVSVTSTVTDANGKYVFANLPFGDYKVTVTPPAGYTATLDTGADAATNSSTGNVTSANLTSNGESDTTLDFGFFAPVVSVGDLVWFDTDGDGVRDAGEPGMPRVTLTVTKADGSPARDVFGNTVTTTTTDANGNYVFANLAAGQYKVTMTPPSGYSATTPLFDTSTNMTTDGASDATLDFGVTSPKVSVGDVVWFDTDRDGVQDPGEPGVAGVTLSILKADGSPATDVFGNPVTTTTTDANGNYLFADLPAGQYTVTATTPSGMSATIPAQGTVATDSSVGSASSVILTADGGVDDTLDFGFVTTPVSVGDLVWWDTDRDGVQDPGEPGIEGVTVTLTNADGSPATQVNGNPVLPVKTDANGNYVFANLSLGQYTVTVTPPDGFVATVSGAGTSVSDSSTGSATSSNLSVGGASDTTLDFGFVTPVVSVGGAVWFDTDRDRVRDPGEAPAANVTVSITRPDGTPVVDANGTPVASTTTSPDGSYLFANLPPGQYKVTITPPSGFETTLGTDGQTHALSGALSSNGASDTTVNFGLARPSGSLGAATATTVVVGDVVWFDTDRDGIQDPDEPGIAGVVLTITRPDGTPVVDADGTPVVSTVTDSNGNYVFGNLPPGSYIVTVTPPAGYVSTSATQGKNRDKDSSTGSAASRTLAGGERDLSLDFGFRRPTAPVTAPSDTSTTPGTAREFSPIEWSTPSKGATFVANKTVIYDVKTKSWTKTVTTKDGTWTVKGGTVRFAPRDGFEGVTSMTFRLTDTSGQVVSSKLTVTVSDTGALPITGQSGTTGVMFVAVLLAVIGLLTQVLFRSRRRTTAVRH